jgi:outer membrane protein TolC
MLGGCASTVLGWTCTGLAATRLVTAVAQAGLTAVPLAKAVSPAIVVAQTPVPVGRVTFDEAIRRAIQKNPSSAIAAAGILRAEALLTEARSASRLQVNGNVTTTTLNRGVEFGGATVTPRNQVNASLDVRYPLFAPARWARRMQAEDARQVAEANVEDVNRQTAFATADAYLTIIARRRVVAANETAREVANAHFNLARQLEQAGTGSRLNMLRAQQELSLDEGLVESARLALYRAQEALGVLLVADGPVDAADEPLFAIPADVPSSATSPPASATSGLGRTEATPTQATPTQTPVVSGFSRTLSDWRPDLRLFALQQRAAERVLRDSSKDAWPFLDAMFQPSTTYPAQFFLPQNSWRFLMQLSVPIVDSGQRAGQRTERQAALDISRATLANAMTLASSEVRAAREAVASAERGLASTRAAADQARQVVDIVNISFRAGAATNIEVIDAERRARDADTAVAVAEDTLRRARLELLTALGRFP